MASTPDEFGRYFGAAPATPADIGPAIGETPPSDDFVRRSKEAAERTDKRWAGKLSPYMQIVTADPGARKEYADKAWQSFLETQEGLAGQSKAINAELDRAREASERGMRQAKAERDRFRLASDARLRLAGVPDSQIKAAQAGEAARDKAFNELQLADKGVLDDYRKASDRLTKNSVAGFFRDERNRLKQMTGVDPLATWGSTSRKKQEAGTGTKVSGRPTSNDYLYADKLWQDALENIEDSASTVKRDEAARNRFVQMNKLARQYVQDTTKAFRAKSDERIRAAGGPAGYTNEVLTALHEQDDGHDKALKTLHDANDKLLAERRNDSVKLEKEAEAWLLNFQRQGVLNLTGLDPLAIWGGTSRKKQEANKTKSAIAAVVNGLYADDRGGQSATDAGDFWNASPEVVERRALAYQSPAQTFDEVDPEPGTYKGTIFELTDPREVAEYRKLKASGEYRDDQVMRLRAMRATRGDEEVRKLAWQARRGRDMALAGRLAREHGGSYSDYYVETTPEDIRRAHGNYGPNVTPKQAMADYYDSTLAYDRDHGSAAEKALARRRGMYLAKRWGLSFNEETAPTGKMARVPVTVSSDGWWYEPGGNARTRVTPDGAQHRQLVSRGKLITDSRARSDFAPTRPGEALRYKRGGPITALVPGRRATGNWKLSAPRRTVLRRWLDEHGEPELPSVSGSWRRY